MPTCLVLRAVGHDPRSAAFLADAHALGFTSVTAITCSDLVFFERVMDSSALGRVSDELLGDPLLLTVTPRLSTEGADTVVETTLLAGVTDARAEAITRGARLIGLGDIGQVATGRRFELTGDLSDAERELLITRLLANAVIERSAVGEVHPTFASSDATGPAEVIAVRDLSVEALRALSTERGMALDDTEMAAVAEHYRKLDRDPTDVELEMIAQTWSEHCNHKTFRAAITFTDGTTAVPLLKQLRNATDSINAPFVRSAFVDNAGIVAFDDYFDLAIKAETHNHPSAVEPFGGSNTGVGGVVRDVLGVSARPIALTDILCFGPTDLPMDELPTGVLHPRVIRAGVIAGVADYGNKLGVPTVSGAIVHDVGYTANPLVFCGCIGVLPTGSNPTNPRPGDRIVVIGGRTGRDGIRGATFSSMEMDATTGDVAGASVQIGDPIVEKGLIDVILEARDAGLYSAITDCGAGGLSSSVGELASRLGAVVDLDVVPRKYPGLASWEVWLSEAQERMVLAVPNVAPLQAICDRYEVELADIGEFSDDQLLILRSGGEIVAEMGMGFLHDGCPTRHLSAVRPVTPLPTHTSRGHIDATDALLAILAHPSLRSNQDVVSGYDHEVLGGTAVRPYGGAMGDGPCDAAVVVPLGTSGESAFALACGVNARFGALDAYRMARACADEAIRNVVAAGADPDQIVLLDNFSWGNPRRPETMGTLTAAVEGCCDAALAHQAPFVSGKDSLNNEYLTADGERRSIPPTLVITAMGMVRSLNHIITSDLKAIDNLIVLVGQTRDELRGSHLDAVLNLDGPGEVPAANPDAAPRYKAVHKAITAGLVRSCHDLSEGGLAAAAAEMVIAGRLGLSLMVEGDPIVALFSESTGRFLVEVAAEDAETFLAQVPHSTVIGHVTEQAELVIRTTGAPVVATVDQLVHAWAGHVPGIAIGASA
jgi:phosphoribosylformylglycinamidine synthase subunit PurSL